MSETPQAAVIRVTRAALVAAGVCEGRVYLMRADASVQRPFAIIIPTSVTVNDFQPRRDFSVQLNVHVVADDYVTAMTEADKVRVALNDRGLQDGAGELNDPVWNILSVSEDAPFNLTEELEDASPVYMDGAIYVFNVEYQL